MIPKTFEIYLNIKHFFVFLLLLLTSVMNNHKSYKSGKAVKFYQLYFSLLLSWKIVYSEKKWNNLVYISIEKKWNLC